MYNCKEQTVTVRELEILQFIATGFTNSKTAAMLHISEFTVETHRKNLNAKLGARNTAMLLKAARNKGLI